MKYAVGKMHTPEVLYESLWQGCKRQMVTVEYFCPEGTGQEVVLKIRSALVLAYTVNVL